MKVLQPSLVWHGVGGQRSHAPFGTVHKSGLRELAVGRRSVAHGVHGQKG